MVAIETRLGIPDQEDGREACSHALAYGGSWYVRQTYDGGHDLLELAVRRVARDPRKGARLLVSGPIAADGRRSVAFWTERERGAVVDDLVDYLRTLPREAALCGWTRFVEGLAVGAVCP